MVIESLLKMNKKGFLRIVEAVIAMMLILGVLIFVSSSRMTNVESKLSKQIPPMLEEISKDNDLREGIVRTEKDKLNEKEEYLKSSFLKERITNPSIGYGVELCEPIDNLCPIEQFPIDAKGEVFAEEGVISSVLPQYSPKKVKIFLWIRS